MRYKDLRQLQTDICAPLLLEIGTVSFCWRIRLLLSLEVVQVQGYIDLNVNLRGLGQRSALP